MELLHGTEAGGFRAEMFWALVTAVIYNCRGGARGMAIPARPVTCKAFPCSQVWEGSQDCSNQCPCPPPKPL